MNKEINARIKHKRDTDTNWMNANPILLDGEIIIVECTDAVKLKIGDGKTNYSQLSYMDDNILDALINEIENNYFSKDEAREYINEIISGYLGNDNITLSTEPVKDDIPKVFIDGVIPTTKDDAQAKLTYISKTHTFDSYINIKCQGTSSMKYPKKNFTIKLFKDAEYSEKLKVDFRGWGEQNKFCLKANWIDLSHARNVVSARLWGDIVKSRSNYNELPELLRTSPNQGAIDGFPIKVYTNGIYQGRYTWNIPKDAWMANMNDELDEHCILCGENYDGGCFRAAPLINETDWSDEIHDVVPNSIKTRWAEVINFVMTSTDDDFKMNLGNYFDVPSLIDYHIFGIAMCGLDSYGKNQIYMTYDGNKWIASMYDLDSTWGLYWNGETIVSYDYLREKFEDRVQGRQGNLLYERMEQNFHQELQARWEELKIGPLSLTNIINRFERFTDIMNSDLIKEDYASTTVNGAYSGIPSVAKNNIQQIRTFAANRRTYTDEYMAALTPIVRIPCTNLTLSASTLTFTGAGTQTLTAIVQPTDTTDKIVWTSSDESIATVNNGVVTSIANGDTIVTATCGEFSVTCSISISGIEEPEIPSEPEVNDNIIYSLPAATTFNGTNYIDTGVAPLAEDTPFTVFVDWTDTNESEFMASKYVIMHCMNENTPYPGMVVQYAPAGLVSEYRQGSNSISSNSTGGMINNADLERAKIVFRKDADGKVTVARCYNENGQIHKNEKTMEYVAVVEALRLGCYRSNNGGTGRFAKGILNDCKVYNYAISDEEMNELLLSTTVLL